MLNRKIGLTAAVALYLALCSGCTSTYIRDNVLKQAASEGKIVADLHVHPNKVNSLEEICETMSLGIIGLTRINGWENGKIGKKNSTIFIYEDAAKLEGFKEIDKDRLGSFTYTGKDGKERTGYVLRCQELIEDGVGDAPGFHLLAVGCNSYVYDIKKDDVEVPLEEKFSRYVEAIHRRGGLAIYAHPYVLADDGVTLFILATSGQREIIKARARICDGIESFNGMACYVPFVGNFNNGNDMAHGLVSDVEKIGLSASDSHIALHNVYRCGIKFTLDENGVNWANIKETITTGNFECVENYSSTFAYAIDNRRFALKALKRVPRSLVKKGWNLVTLVPRVIYNIVTCDGNKPDNDSNSNTSTGN